MRALIVEDDVKLAALLQQALREQAALADAAHDGEDALWMAGSTAYDVVVLDINLPGISGFETCRRLRASRVQTPILMLTARAAIDDKVAALDAGADDYLVKPFEATSASMPAPVRSAEEASRSRCPLRSSSCSRSSCAGPARCCPATTCWRGPETWRTRISPTFIDVYVRYLRDKIDRPFGVRTLETVRGAGYRLSAPGHQP